MRARFVHRCLAPIAAAAALSACQGVDAEADGPSVAAMRLATAAPVSSSQRLDAAGYPLLGAYPSVAAPQLSDAEVARTDAEFNAVAARRAGTTSASRYNARIAALEAARQRQAAEVAARRASQPVAGQTPGDGPRPEDVLKRIEAGT